METLSLMSPSLSRALKEKRKKSLSDDECSRQTNSQKQRPHCVRETARRPVWLVQRVGAAWREAWSDGL